MQPVPPVSYRWIRLIDIGPAGNRFGPAGSVVPSAADVDYGVPAIAEHGAGKTIRMTGVTAVPLRRPVSMVLTGFIHRKEASGRI